MESKDTAIAPAGNRGTIPVLQSKLRPHLISIGSRSLGDHLKLAKAVLVLKLGQLSGQLGRWFTQAQQSVFGLENFALFQGHLHQLEAGGPDQIQFRKLIIGRGWRRPTQDSNQHKKCPPSHRDEAVEVEPPIMDARLTETFPSAAEGKPSAGDGFEELTIRSSVGGRIFPTGVGGAGAGAGVGSVGGFEAITGAGAGPARERAQGPAL